MSRNKFSVLEEFEVGNVVYHVYYIM